MEYVEYGGLGSAPGPLDCKGTTLNCFWVEADKDRLRTLCRRVFNEPSGCAVQAEPLLPLVMLTFGEIKSIAAGSPFDERGRVTERQVGVWVPVSVTYRDAEGGLNRNVGFFLPWMWLDNPVSVASGREVYGYPKTWGWATFPEDPHRRGIFDFGGDKEPYKDYRPIQPSNSDGAFQLDSFALGNYSPQTPLCREELLRVEPVEEEAPGCWAWLDRLETGPIGLGLLLALIGGTMKQFFLRQFRSPIDGSCASFQDIVRADAVVDPGSRPEVSLLGAYKLKVSSVDSDPLAETLGIKDGCPTYAEMKLDFDFEIRPGEILWSSAP